MIYQCWLSIRRKPLKLMKGILIFAILYFIFSYLISFDDQKPELIYTLINISALMMASFVNDTNVASLKLIHREKKLLNYCLSNIFINTIILFAGTLCITIFTLKTRCIVPLLPITAIFLNATLLELLQIPKSIQHNLGLLIVFPLILPVLLASLLIVIHPIPAICFLIGWILIHLALLAVICSPRLNRSINLS